ncbi:MAG: PilZ domain-containing protein [Sterolibacterium sp.]|jgi:hypothetical protein|nr:PilZ domain-containing protein [Sterolibacterium sp.]
MSSERRQFIRFPLHSHVEVQFRGMNCVGTLQDISLSGALFTYGDTTPCCNAFLRPCRVHLDETEHENSLALIFNGLVVHTEDGTLGIKFIGVGEKERKGLIRLFELNQADPILLDRDVPALLKFLASLKPEANDTTPLRTF